MHKYLWIFSNSEYFTEISIEIIYVKFLPYSIFLVSYNKIKVPIEHTIKCILTIFITDYLFSLSIIHVEKYIVFFSTLGKL